MENRFAYLLRVRYVECDAQQVVFFGRYAEYADIAVTEFLRQIWGNYTDLTEQGMDNHVVHLSVDYRSPARFDDVLALHVGCSHVGKTSYTLTVDVRNHMSDQLLATIKLVYVMISTGTHDKLSIPPNMGAALEKGAPGVVTDHAGAVVFNPSP
ncbi:MAG: acyl-CoA thioesterase [Desulfobacterales bacterium]|nr:acyl-CoA thioesterase [Desulfobacterales bacterium]